MIRSCGAAIRTAGYRADRALHIEDSGECVVLLCRDQGPKSFRNLLRLRPDGSVARRAELPDASGADDYVTAVLGPEGLTADSWSGCRVTVDLGSGRILSRVFAK
jgi:hypothetical protein